MANKNNIIKDTKNDEWPSTIRNREELDSALESGLKSGVSTRTIDEIFESAIAKVKNG